MAPANHSAYAVWRGIAFLLGCFAGLCAIFALVAAAVIAIHERIQAHWPAAEARVEKCAVRLYRSSRRHFESNFIECRITYLAGGTNVSTAIRSALTPVPARVTAPDPWAVVNQMQQWVDFHSPGTSLWVHYDRSNPRRAVLVSTDMPLAGPRTPNNLRVLGLFCALCAVLLLIGKRPRPASRTI